MNPIGCDTVVALPRSTRGGQTVFGKNSDRPPDECQPLEQHPRRQHPEGAVAECRFVRVPEVATTYRHVGSRPYWCWGYEHGFNEHQVVIGNEGLRSRLEFTDPKLIGMELVRLGLERARTAVEAVGVIAGLVSRRGQGRFANDAGVVTYDNGFLVADPREAYVIETAGHEWAVKPVAGATGISNVCSIGSDWSRISPGAERTAISQGWWAEDRGRLHFGEAYGDPELRHSGVASGTTRRARSCGVLKQHASEIDARLMMALLGDHSDGVAPEEPFRADAIHRNGICFHANDDGTGGNTAASLVADLCADGSRLPVYWCSFYSPCLGVFFPVFIEGTIPGMLAIGGAKPSSESAWWLFHRLAQQARAEPARVPAVRQTWSELQERLFATAYPLATDAQRQIAAGRRAEAERSVTEYMEANVREMLAIASELPGSGCESPSYTSAGVAAGPTA